MFHYYFLHYRYTLKTSNILNRMWIILKNLKYKTRLCYFIIIYGFIIIRVFNRKKPWRRKTNQFKRCVQTFDWYSTDDTSLSAITPVGWGPEIPALEIISALMDYRAWRAQWGRANRAPSVIHRSQWLTCIIHQTWEGPWTVGQAQSSSKVHTGGPFDQRLSTSDCRSH